MSKKRKNPKITSLTRPRKLSDPKLYEWEPRILPDDELYASFERGNMPPSALPDASRGEYEAYLRKKKRFDLLGEEAPSGKGPAGAQAVRPAQRKAKASARKAAASPTRRRPLSRAPQQPDTLTAWKHLARELKVALGALEEDEVLILQIKGTNRFVQFAQQGSYGMRAESTSNYYLPEGEQLDEAADAALKELGWRAPTNLPDDVGGHRPDGSANYFLDLKRPAPLQALAELAVDTLRQVFGAEHPLDLQYQAFGPANVSIRLPNLGLRRALR